MSHREQMDDVPAWKRRKAARDGVVEFTSRDSRGWSEHVKREARVARRAADKRATRED